MRARSGCSAHRRASSSSCRSSSVIRKIASKGHRQKKKYSSLSVRERIEAGGAAWVRASARRPRLHVAGLIANSGPGFIRRVRPSEAGLPAPSLGGAYAHAPLGCGCLPLWFGVGLSPSRMPFLSGFSFACYRIIWPVVPCTAPNESMKLVLNPPTPWPNWQASVSTRKTRPTIMERAVEGKCRAQRRPVPSWRHVHVRIRASGDAGCRRQRQRRRVTLLT